MVIDPETGLCVAECAPIVDAVDEYYRLNDCVGFTMSNWLGLVGLSPCGQSRDEVQRLLLQAAAKQRLEQDKATAPFLPFIPAGGPNNAEISDRIARHIGEEGAEHGFGKLSTDEIAVQVENLLNRAAANDANLLSKTIREGTPNAARVIYDPESGLMVVVNPSAPGFGTALGGRTMMQYFNFGG
jgi:hypothetical protein